MPNLYRSTVGFERLFDELGRFSNSSNSSNNATGYPPYNIAQIDEDEYMISLAVAGFDMESLDITKNGNLLTIEGNIPGTDEYVNYLHKGIASRNFTREFTLADHVYVQNATLELGMLNIHLRHEVPEELQPQKIAIQKASESVSIDTDKE
jgi:molecular chaperone IbpA